MRTDGHEVGFYLAKLERRKATQEPYGQSTDRSCTVADSENRRHGVKRAVEERYEKQHRRPNVTKGAIRL
jgi:hypothetical protein